MGWVCRGEYLPNSGHERLRVFASLVLGIPLDFFSLDSDEPLDFAGPLLFHRCSTF